MSFEEFNNMSTGMDMYPRTWKHKAKTNSTGFCFLPEQVRMHDDGDIVMLSPLDCLRFLRGIVSEDVLVEFEAPEAAFRQTEGSYASTFSDDWEAFCSIEELCCDSYNRDTFVPLRYMPEPDYWCAAQREWYQYN